MGLPVVSSSECDKCATTKSGRHSCCARGGAWFKKCGDAGDHTWIEGIQACKGFATSVSVKLSLQGILYPEEMTVDSTTKSQNASQQRKNINRLDHMFSSGTTDSRECIEVTKVVVCILVWSMIS